MIPFVTKSGCPSGIQCPIPSHLVRQVRQAAGGGFVVAICGEIMMTAELPQAPAAERIGIETKCGTCGFYQPIMLEQPQHLCESYDYFLDVGWLLVKSKEPTVIRKFEENGKKYVEIQQQATTHRGEM